MAWLKHSIDGLTDAAIWTDDSVVTWQPPTITVQPGQPGGVTITVAPTKGSAA
jgi:Holliday junction resolvase RusA-like endonuclease